MNQTLLMHINNSVFLRNNSLVMIDRRFLPVKQVEMVASDYEQVAGAIENMVVQGAGDIAITAAYGLYLAACQFEQEAGGDQEKFMVRLYDAAARLIRTRPTGHHLAALLNKMLDKLNWKQGGWPGQLLEHVEAAILRQQFRSEATGRAAAQVLEDGDTILTHCFPGAGLLYMLAIAREHGKEISVIASETRPYLQGARLTAWAVSELDIPVTLITDNMAAYCMSEEMVDKVFTAADRIAMDGTVANKVGTLQLALIARYHQVPFYILGYGGPDQHCATAKDIPIEIRDPEEVLNFAGNRITGDKVQGFYPAFDLTSPQLVQEIFTDRGSFIPYHIHKYWEKDRITGINE
ncbi:MAG: s-methyl-5-thioribose-1-phosphate isomerase [Syntrophomonadaceae bacterium]